MLFLEYRCYMFYVLCILSVIVNSFWRRWFGGGYKNTWLGNNRAVQCTIYLLYTSALAYYLSRFSEVWYNAIFAAIFSVLTYCEFWSRGHGACFDIGRGKFDETTINRYNARWYHIPCDWLLKNHKYGFMYDFLYMGLRYTMPLVLLYILGLVTEPVFGEPLFTKWIIVIGASISQIYAICWTLYEKENWIFKKYWSVVGPTNLSEYLAGAVWGLWPLCIV